MSITPRLEHIGIGVTRDKYDETIAFYERVFGWRRIRENPGDFTFLSDGVGGRMEILLRDTGPIPAPHHTAFVVDQDQFDRMIEVLREAGVSFQEPVTTPAGDRLLYFHDPAGNYAQIVGRNQPLGV